MAIRAVVFDRDGVLTRFDFQSLAAFFTPLLPFNLVKLGQRLRQWGEQVGFPKDAAAEKSFWQDFCNHLSDELGLSISVREQLLNFDYLNYMSPYPDAEMALKYAHKYGLKVGVVSNNPMTGIYSSLQAMGLDQWVDAVCAAEVIGYAKPHPNAYLNVTDALGVTPSECLYFDDEEICVEGARALGMQAYMVVRPTDDSHGNSQDMQPGISPELAVSDLTHLPGLLI